MDSTELKEKIGTIHNGGGVEVMKASAGSGKTYSLAREYIRLLMMPQETDGLLARDPRSYRHILAVTFTNKATGEMKSRIIEELHTLATEPARSPYLDYLKAECRFDDDDRIRSHAARLLSNILNDYGAFSVSTIDKFFQQTLRAFSREVGQFAEYQIELDRNSLVTECAERVLDSLSEEKKELLEWLTDSTLDFMYEGEKCNLDAALLNFAKGYMSQAYKEKAKEAGVDKSAAFSEGNLKKLIGTCRSIRKQFENDLIAAVEEARKYLSACTDVKANILSGLDKIASFDFAKTIDMGSGLKTIMDVANGDTAPVTQKGMRLYGDADIEYMRGLIAGVYAFSGDRLKLFNTAVLLEKQIYVFRVAEALDEEFASLLKEKNVLSIDDTNAVLQDIIGHTDTPFIYEKMGVRYNHFLLDEFQDTARVQWDNFLPLLRNSISEGCYNLIVGDVKQSIYRWRNADWHILNTEVYKEFGEERTVDNPLETNWRSARNIVEFNNGFYEDVASHFDDFISFNSNGIPSGNILKSIYGDVRQKASDKMDIPGCVEVTFCDSKTIVSHMVEAVLDAIGNRGFKPGDIAVLVRTKREGASMAKALIDQGISVITNDSLKIGSGAAVRRLVGQLYKYENPDEAVKGFYAGEFDPAAITHTNSLYDLAEDMLRQMTLRDEDTLYVLAFMDLVRDYVGKNGNSLNGFLKYWEEEGMDKMISSPEGGDSVTVITIHKSKGLDFPFVVLPFPAKHEMMKADSKYWEALKVESGSPFAGTAPALYNVGLSGSSLNTLFADNYIRERNMTYVDIINTWYVAMTRASQSMHIISPMPCKGGWDQVKSVAHALYLYIVADNKGGFEPVADVPEGTARYICGEPSPKWVKPESSDHTVPEIIKLKYATFDNGNVGGKLRISADARDFFSPEGNAGISASNRLRGTVMHEILSAVRVPSDLHAAVASAVHSGKLDETEGEDAERLLASAISSVSDRGWFDPSNGRMLNERGILDAGGDDKYRPDRVIVRDGRVDIIDYKFGRELPSYRRQVGGYASLYRQMGYPEVHAWLWYIGEDGHMEEVVDWKRKSNS